MKTDASKPSLAEEYYPISPEILSSFPKYRPTVDLFIFDEVIGQLYPVGRKEQRLSNEKIAEIAKACDDGILFVSRSDHHIYVEHLAKQADFILIDPNLRDVEIRQILTKALYMRFKDLVDQPLTIVYEHLYKDLMVFVEYLSHDHDRIKLFMADLYIGDDELIPHSVNALIVGTWLYFQTEQKIVRKTFERIVQGLMLHDLGCSKIPQFILKKKSPFTIEEQTKYNSHPLLGTQLVQKFGYSCDEINQAVFQHHERLDGSGFPNRLSGARIGQFGLLTAVADTFSSMITKRSTIARVKTLDAAQALFKNQRFSAKYTGVLLKAYANGTFPNI